MGTEPGPGRIDEDGAVLGDPGGLELTVEVIVETEVLVAEPGIVGPGHDVEPEGVPLVERGFSEHVVLDEAQVDVAVLADDERAGPAEVLEEAEETDQLFPGGCSGMVVWKFRKAQGWGAVDREESLTSARSEPKSAKVISRGLLSQA